MDVPYDFEMIKLYLKNHGYNIIELNAMDNEKLFNLYKEHSLKVIYEFQTSLHQNNSFSVGHIKNYDLENQLKSKLLKIGKNFSKIYDLIDEYIDRYSYEDFLEILCMQLDTIPPSKLEKILKVKYRQLQQVWLEKLEEKFKILPVEERIPLVKYYEKNQDDIAKLKRAYQDSKDPSHLEKIKKISEIKLNIIKIFMPSLMEENYKAYYDETPEKLELIDHILELTNSYSKKYLKDLTISKLKFLKNDIIEQNKREAQDKKLFQKYTKALSESMNSMDDNEFSKVCLDAIAELNSDQLQRVVSFLASKNKFFLNKFNTTVKSYQSIAKTKIVQ
ncbi:hypothetical protein BKH41_00755 [Helicobacter sp. 12S02232-10]|uniref:hypothetical protein n=1 Tax=Helicobacter sp. 12S02232-10 TaxID=1476197 RepID=UPI000BA7E015|nr:hypothetical protein [Helicobacter sp. 12S02232-10]PAF49864.1 hypothetical protein BKH41_00755 [Helicobacter sp. 12S02232-10]